MLFNSLEFVIFFAVVATQFFNTTPLIRWSLALLGVAFPIIQAGGSVTSLPPTTLTATAFIIAGLGFVTYLRRYHSEGLARKVLLTLASLLFYSAWKWPFTSLLLFSTILDYTCAKRIRASAGAAGRKLFLAFSVMGNLGVLCVFKYTDFILENVNAFLGFTGYEAQFGPTNIILPLGISFYTFQTMSYTIDVYRGVCEPRKSILDVALYVTFFPQLVAGPILRASHFLPQLDEKQVFNPEQAKSGLLLMIWGMGKKLLVADALAPIVNQAYANPDLFSGPALLLATYAFAFQIYCDFSGYSDLAIGAARVLGFDVPLNFKRPYFAPNITVFWRRWHISLSAWLRDYLYISLGGSRCSRGRTMFNLLATMLLGGLWHGASWNFVIWGGIHGVALALHKLWLWWRGQEKPAPVSNPAIWVLLTAFNFHLVCLTWVFFRAETFDKAWSIIARVFSGAEGQLVPWLYPAVLISVMVLVQAVQARMNITAQLLRSPRLSRYVIYFGIILMLAVISSSKPVDFIYFVF